MEKTFCCDSGIYDQYIDGTELGDCSLNDVVHMSFGSHITLMRHRPAPKVSNATGNFMHLTFSHVKQTNARTLAS